MKGIDINTTLIDGYLQLLKNLSADNKIKLIKKLAVTLDKDSKTKVKSFYKSFGAWDSKQTADEIINELRNSRTYTRKTEQL